MKEPNFSSIHPDLIGQAWSAWNEGDIFGVLITAGHQERGRLLCDNITAFKERGFYETALFETYIHGPHLHPANWRTLFMIADREKLLATGDSIPSEPMIVFRGVSDTRHRRFIRGMSWTTKATTAAWFAMRWTRPGWTPAVYSLRVSPGDVFFMTNERAEDEAVIAAWDCGRMKRLKAMPEAIKPD